MKSQLLFVSNGVGEDLIAARVIASLPAADVAATAYPLVGVGAYPPHVPLLDPRRDLPSGGFSLRTDLRGLGADLASGIIGLWFAQRRALVAQRGRFDRVVAVGDVYCLWMAHLAAPRAALVATADSVRAGAFNPPSLWALRRHARRIFARDPDTATALTAMGLPAVWLGNVMMDLVQPTGETFGLAPEVPVVTLLPGSRREAPENAALLVQAALAIAREIPDLGFLMALASTVALAAVRERIGTLQADGTRLHLTTAFADAAARASVVIGMAGTANEQAAGLGKPVVVFPGAGAQFGPEFLRVQHLLLGEALVPTRDWCEAAGAVVRLLRDPAECERRGAVGRERMGPSGGAEHIASALLEMDGG
jgi:uncharacterized protein (TIGR03492 family)